MTKRKQKYTISDKVRTRMSKQMDINKRIKVFTLIKGGMSPKDVAAKFKCSRQSIEEMYKKIKNQTVEDLESLLLAQQE